MEIMIGSITNLITMISTVTGEAHDTVCNRFFDEIMLLGTNVTRDMHKLGVKPHYYSDKLEQYYANNDSFLYELVVYHLSKQRQSLGDLYVRIAKEYCESIKHDSCSVLCLGDGIGVDTLSFMKNGFTATYFEFPSKSYDFARILWEKQGVRPRVITELSEIPERSFNIVLCSDVLEHVRYPEEVIRNIANYLMDDGIAIVTAAYPAITPNLSTHLFENLKYWGNTLQLFGKNNMILSSLSEIKGMPLVFRKYENKSRYLKELIRSYGNKRCVRVMIDEYLNKIRRMRVVSRKKHKIKDPAYLLDVVARNNSPLLRNDTEQGNRTGIE